MDLLMLGITIGFFGSHNRFYCSVRQNLRRKFMPLIYWIGSIVSVGFVYLSSYLRSSSRRYFSKVF